MGSVKVSMIKKNKVQLIDDPVETKAVNQHSVDIPIICVWSKFGSEIGEICTIEWNTD